MMTKQSFSAVGRLFSSVGIEYESFLNPTEALDAYELGKYSVIVLDIQMPTLDGLRVAERIRGRECDAPIVFCNSF